MIHDDYEPEDTEQLEKITYMLLKLTQTGSNKYRKLIANLCTEKTPQEITHLTTLGGKGKEPMNQSIMYQPKYNPTAPSLTRSNLTPEEELYIGIGAEMQATIELMKKEICNLKTGKRSSVGNSFKELESIVNDACLLTNSNSVLLKRKGITTDKRVISLLH